MQKSITALDPILDAVTISTVPMQSLNGSIRMKHILIFIILRFRHQIWYAVGVLSAVEPNQCFLLDYGLAEIDLPSCTSFTKCFFLIRLLTSCETTTTFFSEASSLKIVIWHALRLDSLQKLRYLTFVNGPTSIHRCQKSVQPKLSTMSVIRIRIPACTSGIH